MDDSQAEPKAQEPLSRRERVDRVCDDYERQWRAGEKPQIESFLSDAQEDDRELLLRELIVVDLMLRNESGEKEDPSDYSARFGGQDDIIKSAVEFFWNCDTKSIADYEVDSETPAFRPDQGDKVPAAIGRNDRYRIIRLLGQGGFASVYLARDSDLDREVAIKIPRMERFNSEAALDFFVDEARKAAQLDHPGIVRVYDVQREQDLVYIVQQYVNGGDLTQHANSERLAYRPLVELMISIAKAIGYAHQQGWLHLDLKPANILLDSNHTAYIADFGLALHESAQAEMQGRVLGTYAYMSPAQIRGEAHRLDGRADIWSLGVILYELLTGRRPFSGRNLRELVDQIAHQEPRPPRQIDPAIPPGLSRIPLVCLAKHATDRYSSTADLIDDLEHWLKEPTESGRVESKALSDRPDETTSDLPTKVIPQGLRSFEAEHADFFLQLLPGPHDREGLPKRVRFWKTQIEKTDADETFSVGLMYGPSGCGKSSLVKAALIPRITNQVLPIYVEATAEDTEVRLIKALRKQCPQLPVEASLPDMIAQLRREGGFQGRKVLIVLDQFEQWLHAHQSRTDSQLIPALRHCDGGSVQSIVMVRDDFWISAARFMQDLEIPLVEGHNSALVDLFEPRHAVKVLTAFGQAYGQLPELPAEPSEQQSRFLQHAVDGLSDEGKVICVRLAVFAEMMKGRDWTEESLTEVGGTEGIGVTFLEETFSARTAPPAHRLHQDAIRAVLRELLPESGTDIKGQMKSRQQLLEASGYAQRPKDFDTLLGILDGQVRLITPTEPDESAAQSDKGTETSRYYQLTHDFLVPSLREWLTRKQKETRQGRAELALADRTAVWNARPENRQLPSLWQWLQIRRYTRASNWTAAQRKMMVKGGRVHGLRSLLTIVALVLVSLGSYGTYGWLQGRAAVEALLTADPQSVLNSAEKATAYRFWTGDKLQRLAAGKAGTRDERRRQRHARLALVPFDSSHVDPLLDDAVTTGDTAYVGVIREALLKANAKIEGDCWSRFRNRELSDRQRFQAGVMLAGLVPRSEKWNDVDFQLLVNELAALNSVYQLQFWPLLQGVGDRMLPPLEELFRNRARPESEQLAAANAIAFFAEQDAQRLARLLLIAKGPQYNILFEKYREVADKQTEEGFAARIQREPTNDLDAESRIALGKDRAISAITLLRQGKRESILNVLGYESDPEALTQFVHRCRARDVTPTELMELLDIVDQRRGPLDGDRQKIDDSAMYALLLALGEYSWDDLPPKRETLVERLEAIYEKDPSSGVHSATGWLLRQWGQREAVDRVNQTPLAYDATGHREWFVREIECKTGATGELFAKPKTLHFTFVVFQPREFAMGSPDEEPGRESDEMQHQVTLTRPIAVCDRELTWAQWMPREGTGRRDAYKRQFSRTLGDNDPVFGVDWFDAVSYCHWLGKQAGLSKDEQCYEDPSSLPKVVQGKPANWRLRLEGAGFRLATEAEWEFVCRSGTGTAYSFGHDADLLAQYAWFLKNSGDWLHPTGQLRPNPRGLFDIHGNLYEWCHDWFGPELSDATNPKGADTGSRRGYRGGSWSDAAWSCRSSYRCGDDPTLRYFSLGFRLAVVPSSQASQGDAERGSEPTVAVEAEP